MVWATTQDVPEALKTDWQWSDCGCFGVRRNTSSELGQAKNGQGELALVGTPAGRRGKREWTPPDQAARQMLLSLATKGLAGLDELLGPVAGFFLDHRSQEILVWRDRFGRLPIQMVRQARGWVITTSPELVMALTRPRAHWNNLASFVHGEDDCGDQDVLLDVYRLRPGEAIRLRGPRLVERVFWWQPAPLRSDDPLRELTAVVQQIGNFYAQRSHLLALSAGLDSSTIAAFATARNPGSKAVTFYDPRSSRDETEWASQTARHLNLSWSPFCVTDHWPFSRMEDLRSPLAWGPTAHPDAAWKQPFHRWTQSQWGPLPVVYGNGSDEVLWFPSAMWLQSRWAAQDVRALVKAFPHLPLTHFFRPAAALAIDRAGLGPLKTILPDLERPEPLWRQTSRWIQTGAAPAPLIDATDPLERFHQLRIRRLQTWGWERIMRSLATESWRAGRPIWTPFLDAEFWELSLTLSPHHLVEEGRQKSVLRQAVKDLLPEACRLRPKVGGFDPLVERGLAEFGSHTIFALLARPSLSHWQAFDRDAFIEAFEAYRRAPATTKARSYRGSWAIWRTLAAELWLRSLESSTSSR